VRRRSDPRGRGGDVVVAGQGGQGVL
jgi:hypothetical protein